MLDSVDWTRPWLAPLVPLAKPICAADDWRQALNDAAHAASLCNHRGLPIRFVPQSDLPSDLAYEAFISDTGCVPTRDNLHDFFNALVWLRFPKIKKQLNALQAAELAKNAVAADVTDKAIGTRGKVRDAATIFDENAALLIYTDDALVSALRSHHWQELFLARRHVFGQAIDVFLFGHALMEKLVTPYKAITAHVWPLKCDGELFARPLQEQCAWLDTAVSRQLQQGLQTGDFTPLPVLGVPGWWEGQDDAFYADAAVFRPRRQSK